MEERDPIGTDSPNGAEITTETVVELPDQSEAELLFEKAKKRLLDVNHWQELTGNFLANFQLVDSQGNAIDGGIQEGNLFKINIPGPGSEQGGGFDWVSVESIREISGENSESISITVRPSANPLSENNATAHFYDSEGTSTFNVTRKNNKVTASVLDQNLKPNTQTDGILDQIRNALVGTTGIMVFSKLQWKKLTEGLLDQDN